MPQPVTALYPAANISGYYKKAVSDSNVIEQSNSWSVPNDPTPLQDQQQQAVRSFQKSAGYTAFYSILLASRHLLRFGCPTDKNILSGRLRIGNFS
jgi:hypothetical protein